MALCSVIPILSSIHSLRAEMTVYMFFMSEIALEDVLFSVTIVSCCGF